MGKEKKAYFQRKKLKIPESLKKYFCPVADLPLDISMWWDFCQFCLSIEPKRQTFFQCRTYISNIFVQINIEVCCKFLVSFYASFMQLINLESSYTLYEKCKGKKLLIYIFVSLVEEIGRNGGQVTTRHTIKMMRDTQGNIKPSNFKKIKVNVTKCKEWTNLVCVPRKVDNFLDKYLF